VENEDRRNRTEEPGIATRRIQESSLLFLKALHWLRLTLHEMTPVQMLRVVRGIGS